MEFVITHLEPVILEIENGEKVEGVTMTLSSTVSWEDFEKLKKESKLWGFDEK